MRFESGVHAAFRGGVHRIGTADVFLDERKPSPAKPRNWGPLSVAALPTTQ